jgi:hypothetical protein
VLVTRPPGWPFGTILPMTALESHHLDDGTTVRFLLADARQSASEYEAPTDGLGPVIPVGRRREAVAAVAANALRNTLKPLGPLVQEVHDAVTAVGTPPAEITVTFGVQLSQDLKLGIVNGNGQAHLTITATWSPQEAPSPGPRAGAPHTDRDSSTGHS